MKVHNEKLVEKDGIEYRIWNPNRSKLAAAINNGLEYLPINIGSKVLCFNASEITVSHISDIVGKDGIVYFVTDKKLLSNNFLKKMHPIRSNIIIIIVKSLNPKINHRWVSESLRLINNKINSYHQIRKYNFFCRLIFLFIG